MSKKLLLGSLLALVFLSANFSPAHAQALSSTSSAKLQERCGAIKTHLEQLTQTFQTRKTAHDTQYRQLHDRLQTLIDRLDQNNYDTTQLKIHQTIMDNRVKKFSDDYALWLEQLTLAQESSCNQAQGTFRTAMEKARALSKVVQADALEIRNYYQKQVRPEIKRTKGNSK